MLVFGHITNYDDCGRVVVELDETGFKTDFIPVLVLNSEKDKSGSPIDINSFVAVILDETNPMNGVCLGVVNTLPRKSVDKLYHEFSDGTILEYDRAAHILTADVKGEINATATKMTLNGDLYVNGDINCSKDVSDKKGTMQAMREIYNKHKNLNDGTAAPTPQM